MSEQREVFRVAVRGLYVNNKNLLKLLKEVKSCATWCRFLSEQSSDICASVPKVTYNFKCLY